MKNLTFETGHRMAEKPLSPELWQRLEKLERDGSITFSLYWGSDDAPEINFYEELCQLGYAVGYETGPGFTFVQYSITEQGKQALSNNV
jgi:hypothetical protein